MREYNPDLDRALRADAARRELRRVLRWPPVPIDHDTPDSTRGPARCACGVSSKAVPGPRGVIRITRVVRQQTVVTEAPPERPLREEAAGERYKGLFWLSIGVMVATVALDQQGTGPGVLVMTMGVAGALVGCVGALVRA